MMLAAGTLGILTRSHCWLGIALVLPLLLWTVTGLLFHLKPSWPGAFEMLNSGGPDAVVHPVQLVPSPLPPPALPKSSEFRVNGQLDS